MDADKWLQDLAKEDLQECLIYPKKLRELFDDFLDSCRNDPYDLMEFHEAVERTIFSKTEDE